MTLAATLFISRHTLTLSLLKIGEQVISRYCIVTMGTSWDQTKEKRLMCIAHVTTI